MKFRSVVLAVAMLLAASSAQAQSLSKNWAWKKLPDPRGEFVRLCAPHMVGRWAHPESVCICLHDHAVAGIEDSDLREALLRGISETGVPAIENDWVPATKRPQINAAITQIARPTLQCMFEPAT
ncbi:MAG: hypothetical protein JWR73_1393 [Tardiphaga sp.]|nr:hypothetical protein [Tardiphaga sp.]